MVATLTHFPDAPRMAFEIRTKDLVRTAAFYGSVFGWTFHLDDDGVWIYCDGQRVEGAVLERPGRGVFTTYVTVDDIEETARAAEALGAAVRLERTPIPGLGSFVHLEDPDGNIVAIYEPSVPSASA